MNLSFASFSDVSTHKYKISIDYLVSIKTLNGYEDGTFKPDQTINRAELMKVLIAGQGIFPDAGVYKNCFIDVKSEWFAPFVCYGKEKGWVNGYADGTFKPSQAVSKAEALKILVHSMEWEGLLKNYFVKNVYNDVDANQWYFDYLSFADNLNLVLTESVFLPSNSATRAEVSELIFRSLVVEENNLKEFSENLMDIFLESKNFQKSEIVISEDLFEVSKVVDGDTIHLTNGDKIRLLGINSPEVGYCYYKEAGDYLSALIGKSKITMKSDATNQDKDRYGRLLRYIYVDGEMLNIKMVEDGYAEYMKAYPIIYSLEFAEAEKVAKDSSKGMWGKCENIIGNVPVDSNNSSLESDNLNFDVYISYVFYDGIVPKVESDEYVEVKNRGKVDFNLNGYYIKGSKGSEVFYFGNLVLKPLESVKVYTNQGTYSFKSNTAIWNNSGETAYLYNPNGQIVSEWSW